MTNHLSLWCVLLMTSVCVTTRADEPTDSRRPTSIQTEEVPPIPQEVFERLRQYSHIRQADFAGWSPDGKGMLVRSRFGNSTQLHRVYEPGGRREQLTFFDEPVDGRPVPGAKDGAVLLSMSREGRVAIIDAAMRVVGGYVLVGETPDGVAYTTRVIAR